MAGNTGADREVNISEHLAPPAQGLPEGEQRLLSHKEPAQGTWSLAEHWGNSTINSHSTMPAKTD